MPALTETEARARAALIDVDSYEIFADLTAEPVRSRTEIRFTCAEPGAPRSPSSRPRRRARS